MKKIVFALLLFFLFLSSTYALEICTPSEEYLKYMKLTDEEKKEYIEPPYCKELMKKDEEENSLISFIKDFTNTISASSLDSSYNSVNYNLITTPQNQGSLGTCWAFSSISAVEANARKNNIGSYDFSEKHMIYSLLSAGYSDSEGKKGKYNVSNFNGGKVTYAVSYYFNDYGQLLESDWKYTDSNTKITSSEYKVGKKMISVGGFSLSNVSDYGSCSSSEISYIKKEIINNGSVQMSMYMDESLFKDTAKNYYISSTSNSSLPNHGVSIVGWDDNVSKTKFGASRDGAFIVKNSWGSTWSSDGYFYISYDDAFVCKNTSSFYDVSNKVYENTYASADMVGIPTIMFTGTLYTSAKFQKSSNNEELKRVSFPVGENLNYYVYLVTNNNLTSTSGWSLLTSGYSEVYGIESVDVSGYTLTGSDFTIVVKYNGSSASSIFTMCNNVSDTSQMEYSSGKNYYSSSLSDWSDMKNITIQNTTISCEPNIFVYTNNVIQEPVNGTITIDSITPYTTSSTNKKFTVRFTNNNVSNSVISYMITNSNNINVTSNFTIVPNYSNNTVTIESNGTQSGRFNFIIKYGNKEARTTFNIVEYISIKDSSFISITGSNLMVSISNNYELTKKKLLNGLNISNSSVKVLNKKGNVVNDDNAIIGTNAQVVLNSSTYKVVVLGDVNCDGKISALDYIEVRKYIMGSKITDSGMLKASDMDKNNSINALDYIAIRMILMR